MESITISCYIECELSSWMMDGGCSQHITTVLRIIYPTQRSQHPGTAEIANGTEMDIIGMKSRVATQVDRWENHTNYP